MGKMLYGGYCRRIVQIAYYEVKDVKRDHNPCTVWVVVPMLKEFRRLSSL